MQIAPDALTGKYKAAFAALTAIGAPVFVRSDRPDGFMISAEEGTCGPNGMPWADYFEFGVNTAIEVILTKHGLFAEWETAGALGVYEV